MSGTLSIAQRLSRYAACPFHQLVLRQLIALQDFSVGHRRIAKRSARPISRRRHVCHRHWGLRRHALQLPRWTARSAIARL